MTKVKVNRHAIDWGAIWEARDYHDVGIEGYLITEPGEVDAPIAIALVDHNATHGAAEAYRVAFNYMRRGLCAAWRSPESPMLILLYELGKDRLREPMPGFLYGMLCRPVRPGQMPESESTPETVAEVGPFEPRPFCASMAEFMGVDCINARPAKRRKSK